MSTTIVTAFDEKFFWKEILTIDEKQVRCHDSTLTVEVTGGDVIVLRRLGPSMRVPVAELVKRGIQYLVVTVVKDT